jgi:hypothetical protein
MRFTQNASRAHGLHLCCRTVLLAATVFFVCSAAANTNHLPNNKKIGNFFQDSVVVRGKVTGAEEGIVLPQVSIENLVTHRGTFTNLQGEFVIAAHRGDSIRFTYAGKAPRTIIFRGEKFIDVQMGESDRALSEVVVTGYQTIEKKRFSGAAATVKMDDARDVLPVFRCKPFRVLSVLRQRSACAALLRSMAIINHCGWLIM